MGDYVIKLDNIDLIYRTNESLSIRKIADVIKTRGQSHILSSYKALNNISLTLEKGKVYGIIGSNGAGKSTLLRVLSGVMSPNKGSVERNYDTINLLALGIGFSKELTGYDNIYLNGMLLGFNKAEISAKINEIVEYSELEDFIYKPMKTYSSGMVSRLGFSIAIHLKPQVLLIDEILSVGDVKFRQKSFNSLKEIIKDESTTVVIVSHGMGQIEDLCDYSIWLDKGRMVAKGNSSDVLALYQKYNQNLITIEDILKGSVESVVIDGHNKVTINCSDYNLLLPDAEEKVFFNKTYDWSKTFLVGNDIVTLTKRKLMNNDIFVYIDIEKKEKDNLELEILLDNIAEVSKFDHLYKVPPFDNRYGENKVTNMGAYLELNQGSAVVSKIYYYQDLTKTYSDKEHSVVKELISENTDFNLCENSISYSIQNKANKVSFFVLLSNQKLFRDQENLNNFMKYFNDSLYNNVVSCSFFMTPEGMYSKLPYSIEPFTKEGYGFNLQHSSRKNFFSFYLQTNERFYYDFIVNAILQAYLYQTNVNGVFYTPYTSTWVKKDTGITAPYIDTRLNESFILAQRDFFSQVKVFADLDPMKNYMDFLCSYFNQSKRCYHLGSGVFFPDYFKEGDIMMAHASLNHQLGTASLFIKAYKEYNDESYLDMFKRIIEFVSLSCKEWIKAENGDLYYGVREEKGGKYAYYGDDYVYVTLIDLLLCQREYLELNQNQPNESFSILINSKIEYLKGTKYDIFNENAAYAPGENVDSRKLALRIYSEIYQAEK